METRSSRNSEAHSIQRFRVSFFDFRISVFVFLLAVGCGAPGEPTPPRPQVPVAIADLTAQQSGDAVQLTFTLPPKTVSGERLDKPPAIEILRGMVKPDGSPDPKSFRMIETIPGALVGDYRVAEKVQITNRVSADELRSYPGKALAYRVRTRASRKRASADSNTVIVRIRPVPERITSLHAEVTEPAIELSWSAATRTSTGETLPAITEYRVYRGEIDQASADSAAKDLSQAKWKAPLALLASAPTNSYRDAAFDFGKTYAYTVRTVISADGGTVESEDSAPAVVTPRDVYPPAVPQGLVAAVVRSESNGPPEADLSWSINAETDLAGYRVYRSEQQDTPGQLVTPDLLPSPAYRDTSVQPGHLYWYSVTAVDRTGNESARSAPVAVEVAQPFRRSGFETWQAVGSFALIAVRAHLPVYGRLRVFKNAAIRTGVYSGVGMAVVLVAWLFVANRVPSLERFALERNLAGSVALGLFAAVPVIRFLRLPGPLLASGLIAWSIAALAYRLLCVYFWGLAARYSAVHLFTLGAILYMILATLSWIGTCISRARASNVSH